ncbi:chorismate-binding protein [Helicobacter marmotae]|uniref:Aminodeoxychorismate synthase component I n=1 Tax=Helicobacter marmotae TaxID=152490 RepID=A0A3D8I7H6_9HELI|nr:chorismate-binding protein [Helicobacter marmotae]RDU60481.1 aminodeoxychorismate synthase component I [Helicobacter marmotae]
MVIYGSFIYKNPLRKLIAFDIKGLLSLLEEIDNFRSSKSRGYFVGYMTYEAGVLLSTYKLNAYKDLHKALATASSNSHTPLAYFTLFTKRYKIKDTLKKPKDEFHSYILKGLDFQSYQKGFQAIKHYIAHGESYQINFTQEMQLLIPPKPKAFFKYLSSRQNTSYRAYMKNPFMEIMCFSPELFFELKHRSIRVQPMKGTIKRAKTPNTKSDKKLKLMLQNDSKNRSENIMIVDLLRNDLSKIIKAKSLRIKELCAIHSYPTLHQMISTIQGKLKHIALKEILQALFPCGSITGAPKLKTMELIYTLESRLRGVYCGALGVISSSHISLCVPIRTLFRYANEPFYRYGVGSGVVWDSVCEDEFKELELKTQFLHAKARDYEIFETMLYDKGHIFLLAQHLERMYKSACDLGFAKGWLEQYHTCTHVMDTHISHFEEALMHYSSLAFKEGDPLWQRADDIFMLSQIPKPLETCIIKLSLSHSGDLRLSIVDFKPQQSSLVILSPKPLPRHNPLAYHKTSQRSHFAHAQRLIRHNEVFDVIYYNQKGHITEGSRSNIICEIDGRFYTPKLKSALLNGTLRAWLLHNGIIKEKHLGIKDLQTSQRIFCINSVRGIVQVHYSLDKPKEY